MTRNVFTGKVITLNIDTVTLPNGVTIDLEMVRHPGAAAVVPLKDSETVVLIRQFRHAAGGFIYEIPAGKLDRGEDPLHCAARELEEEIGYIPGRQRLDRDEVLEILEIPLKEAIRMIGGGLIRDAKTIVGLQLVRGEK